MTQDEMVRWLHWLNGHDFEQAWRIVDVQGRLAWSSPWCHKESDSTEWLNWAELNHSYFHSIFIQFLEAWNPLKNIFTFFALYSLIFYLLPCNDYPNLSVWFTIFLSTTGIVILLNIFHTVIFPAFLNSTDWIFSSMFFSFPSSWSYSNQALPNGNIIKPY